MEILLGILAVLGKILLLLLGILCFLLLCILFYPIKYQAEGVFQEGARVQGRIQWFWFLVRIPFSYEETFQWSIRIFGLDLLKLMDKSRKRERPGKEKSAKKKAQKINVLQNESREKGQDELKKSPLEEQKINDTTDVESSPRKSVPGRVVDTIKKWWYKFRHFLASMKRFYKNLRQKTGYAWELFSLLREENSRALVCILRDNVVHLWRKLKPKVLRGQLLFGTGDPASTGEILGVFAILYSWYGERIQITPDFQQKILEGEIFIKGSISLFTLLWVFARIFLSDEWRQFKKNYDRISTRCLT